MAKINLKKIKFPVKIKMKKYFDKRGFFQEIFLEKNFNLKLKFTAIAKSKKNVIRGLHFQLKDKQTKFIYVIDGKILDTVVNLKKTQCPLVKFQNLFYLKARRYLFQVIMPMVMNVYQQNVLYYITWKSIEMLNMKVE